MDAYTTNGARAIPKLICLDAETFTEIGTWGPRPETVQTYVAELRTQNMEQERIIENVHAWYAKDRTRTLQAEFAVCVAAWAQAL